MFKAVRNFLTRLGGNSSSEVGARVRNDHRYLVELLLRIEEDFDVNDIVYDNLHLWPIIRLQLGRGFKYGTHEPSQRDTNGDPGTGPVEVSAKDPFPKSREERLALIQAHRNALPSSPEQLNARVEQQFNKLKCHAGLDFVALSKIEKYYQLSNSKRYAPVVDPVIEALSRFGSVSALALEPMPITCKNDPIRIDIDGYVKLYASRNRDDEESVRRKLEALNNVVMKISPYYRVNSEEILRRIARLRVRRDFFIRAFTVLKPKAIFLSAFTGWNHAIAAARTLGIPTVDVQHGGQGEIYFPMTHFGRVPENGYEILPDIFWVWADRDFDNVERWFPADGRRHLPVVGGNRSVIRWHEHARSSKLEVVDRAFIDKYSSGENVLVTLSYGQDPLLADHILESMMLVPEATWLIRLHPIHRTSDVISSIANELNARQISKFSISEPTDVELYTALSVSAVNVTPFSSTAREAIAFGVPAIVCDAIGGRIFREDIEKGVFEFETDPKALAEKIRGAMLRHKVRKISKSKPDEVAGQLKNVLRAVDKIRVHQN